MADSKELKDLVDKALILYKNNIQYWELFNEQYDIYDGVNPL